MVRARPSAGMSLIEVLICITIVAVLSGGAYMAYLDHVRAMKEIVARSNLRKIGEAVQAYNSQNPEQYATSDPSLLVGPFLAELPQDPWGNDYIIDFFFGRAISPGQDLNIDTFCPFPLFHGQVRTVPNSDDLTVDYQQQGRLGCVLGLPTGSLWQMRADGAMASTLVGSNVLCADQVGNGTLVLYCDQSTGQLWFMSMTEEPYTEAMILPAGVTLPSRVAWSPDAVRWAVAGIEGAASVIAIGQTTGTESPFIMSRATGAGVFDCLAWSSDGRQLVCTIKNEASLAKSLWIGTVGAGSTLTEATTDAAEILTCACSPDGRWYAYGTAGNVVKVANVASREVLVTIPNATHPTFSPDGRKVAWAQTGGVNQVWALHLSMVHPPGNLMNATQVKDISVQLSVFPTGGMALGWLSWD